ncbi:MAG: hypothetical protein K9N23_09865 [Akkermansiaceae bacterium]|nr:hypothetical protein [Akkermansiaceae bacterium]
MSLQRRFWVALVAALAGLGTWHGLRVTDWERPVFTGVMRGFANPPLFVSGDGTFESPWALRTAGIVPKTERAKAPVVVSIGDDPQGVFQTAPPSPVDIAVVLKNLQRLGAKQAAVAAVLAWEKPDPVALKGLEIVLGDFQMVVHGTPLTRGTLPQKIPEAFVRASLRTGAITGDVSKLPIINRVAVPDVIYAGEGALAGFTTLDSDGLKDRVSLLARWEEEDRVVLAFPLLAVLARFDLPVGGIKVRLGETLELGPGGPMVPIDAQGCLVLPPKQVPSRANVAAEALVLGEPGIFPEEPGLIVLRDDQSWASVATKRFSQELASVMASIGSDAGLAPAVVYPRLAPRWELLLGVELLLILVTACAVRGWLRWIAFGLAAGVCVGGQWLAAGLFGVWLPGVPLLAALAAGIAMCRLLDNGRETLAEISPVPAVRPPALPNPDRQLVNLPTPRSGTLWRAEAGGGFLPPPTAAPVLVIEPEKPTEPVTEPLNVAVPEMAPGHQQPSAEAVLQPEAEPAETKRKATASKTPAKKAATKKTPARKAATKKTPARKGAAKKTHAPKASERSAAADVVGTNPPPQTADQAPDRKTAAPENPTG